MSSDCGNCDCADKTKCVKKGNSYGIVIMETEKTFFAGWTDAPAAMEHGGKCKCGANCTCTDCTCSN